MLSFHYQVVLCSCTVVMPLKESCAAFRKPSSVMNFLWLFPPTSMYNDALYPQILILELWES